MKQLEYKGRKFLYSVKEFGGELEHGRDFTGYNTYFYDTLPIIKVRKRYWLFGEKLFKKTHNLLFILYCDIESPTITKKYIQNLLDKQFIILDRLEEINNNGIV